MNIRALENWIRGELRRMGVAPLPLATGPDSVESMRAAYSACLRTGRMAIWSGGSDRTIYSGPAANYAFRALHDIQHAESGSDFTLHGERDASAEFVGRLPNRLRRRFGPILRAEIYGQAELAVATGTFAADQIAFDIRYMARGF